MSSFSCPHFDSEKDYCLRLRAECVPGRPGCVLSGKVHFAFSWQERLAAKQAEKEPKKRL